MGHPQNSFYAYLCTLGTICYHTISIVYTILLESREVPVRFNQTTYYVVEGERSVSITVEALADHTFSFSVSVSTRDGTASCE